eukprot:gene11215-biopygen12670
MSPFMIRVEGVAWKDVSFQNYRATEFGVLSRVASWISHLDITPDTVPLYFWKLTSFHVNPTFLKSYVFQTQLLEHQRNGVPPDAHFGDSMDDSSSDDEPDYESDGFNPPATAAAGPSAGHAAGDASVSSAASLIDGGAPSFAEDLVDRRSHTGFAVLASGSLVTWMSKRQPTVAISTSEAEYMALSQATREVQCLFGCMA